eukprot:73242-Amphidinium_carterae.1
MSIHSFEDKGTPRNMKATMQNVTCSRLSWHLGKRSERFAFTCVFCAGCQMRSPTKSQLQPMARGASRSSGTKTWQSPKRVDCIKMCRRNFCRTGRGLLSR